MPTPSVETSIWLALKGRAAELADLLSLPIIWPNESESPGLARYLRVTHIPNLNSRPFLSSTAPHRRLGLLQIDVLAKKNEAAGIAIEMAGQVAAHFPADLRMTVQGITVRVQRAPDIAQGLPDDTHWVVPVTIRYECFA